MTLRRKTMRVLRRLTFYKRTSLWWWCIAACVSALCGIAILGYSNLLQPDGTIEFSHFEILRDDEFYKILNSLPKQSTSAQRRCVPPSLPLTTKYILEHRPKPIPADLCERAGSAANWLRVSQSRVFLKPQFSGSRCTAEPIVRPNDQQSDFGPAEPLENGSELPASLALGFRASCTSPDGSSHSSVYYGVRRAAEVRPSVSAADSSAGLGNIIMLGLDSLSRLESLRSLPRVSHLMQSTMGAVSLQLYNILGDGTPAALLPILTGMREDDMPEARKGFKSARFLDESMRWIFQDLRDRGFLTLYGEEQNDYGAFQLRFVGFKQPPADFYLRPALLKQEHLQTESICIGDELASSRMLTAVKDLFSLHPTRPKFAFVFFSTLSHENKDLSPMDAELSKFLDWFERANLTHNTSIIVMSDHGQRHGPLRNSMQGKLEESLPLMSIALSRQLMRHRRDAAERLRTNSKRLTTPVDIHKTLLSIAGVTDGVKARSDRLRVYSLIDEAVPEERNCSDAGIPTHWCSCLRLTKVAKPNSHELVLRAAQFAVSRMNSATEPFRHLCQELRLGNVTEADISLVHKDLAGRVRHQDKDFSYITASTDLIASGYISVRLSIQPSGGLYEATVQFSLQRVSDQSGLHSVNLALVSRPSRINSYGQQAACISERRPDLRKFCFCKNA